MIAKKFIFRAIEIRLIQIRDCKYVFKVAKYRSFMKKRVLLLVVFGILMIVSLSGVFAETALLDKCTYQTEGQKCFAVKKDSSGALSIFEGRCYNDNCINVYSSTLKLDPDYVQKTIKERSFDPREQGFTIYDDYVCEVLVEVPSYITISSKHDILFESVLVTVGRNQDGSENEAELAVGTSRSLFASVSGLEFKEFRTINLPNGEKREFEVFDWKIKGWPDGLRSYDVNAMELAIKNKNLRCDIVRFQVNKPYITFFKGKELKTNNCVRLEGSMKAPTTFVRFRMTSAGFGIPQLVARSKESVSTFESIEPFKTYKSDFAHLIDLGDYDDSILPIKTDRFDYYSNYDSVVSILSKSDCYLKSTLPLSVLYSGKTSSYSPWNAGFIVINSKRLAILDVHEIGHAFCGLNDEYECKISISDSFRSLFYNLVVFPGNLMNCQNSPDGFKRWFGDYDRKLEPCTYSSLYRPSDNSLMNNEGVQGGQKFNDVSCAYCLSMIKASERAKDNNIKTNWQECMKMDVIKPS